MTYMTSTKATKNQISRALLAEAVDALGGPEDIGQDLRGEGLRADSVGGFSG